MKIITIDGPAAAGKGTVAQVLANMAGFYYFNTGNLFRYLAKIMLDEGILSPDDKQIHSTPIKNTLNDTKNTIINPSNCKLNPPIITNTTEFFNKIAEFSQNVVPSQIARESMQIEEGILHNPQVSSAASQIAAVPEVRHLLKKVMRDFVYIELVKEKGCIVDGRDIGSAIFPEAPCKIFITATSEIRSERRMNQLISKGIKTDLSSTHSSIVLRDNRDGTRKIAPMIIMPDTIVIDTTKIDKESVIKQIWGILLVKFPELTKKY